MRNHNSGDWETFQPLTNVMVRPSIPFCASCSASISIHTNIAPPFQWLHYLVQKLLHYKRLRQPTSRNASISVSASTSSVYTERECYDSLVEMEAVLASAVEVAKKLKPKAKKATSGKKKVVAGPKSAEEVLMFGRERGWVRKQ